MSNSCYKWVLSGRRLTEGMQLVTEVDKAVEKFIVERIREAYPSHKLYVLIADVIVQCGDPLLYVHLPINIVA